MSYYISILKDSPIGFWKLDEASGTSASDSSGCGNNGSYVGGVQSIKIPLVPNGIYSTKITNTNTLSFPITKDFSGQTGIGGFGISKTEDNDFSLELWFHPKNITALTPLFADLDGIGLYWDNGNIVFKLQSERIDYVVPYSNKSFYVVATYSPGIIKLYVDGELVGYKKISSFLFTNQSMELKIGPAANTKYFLADAPAVYRYCLSGAQIKSHYESTIINNSVQVVSGSFGELFKSTIQHQNSPDKFMYPVQKNWEYFLNDNLLYRESSNSIYLNPSSLSAEFVEEVFLISWKDYVSSKIEWFGGSGISVYVSTVSETGPWTQCENGSGIPGLTLGQVFPDTSILFFKVSFTSSDTSLYLPELYYLGIFLYEDKKLYSHNGESFISVLAPTTGSSWDVDISNREHSLLSRNYDNGIRSKGAGFYIQTGNSIYSLEMIMTPVSLGSGYLFYNKTNGVESSLSWNSSGLISKANVSSVYINGQDISSATNISSYLNIDEPNYLLIKMSTSISGQIWVNSKSDNSVRSGILPNNIYNTLSIYQNSDIDHQDHYLMYIGQNINYIYDSGFSVTQRSADAYGDDWVSINNG